LNLYRNGARVTLVHRNKELGRNDQVLVRPDMRSDQGRQVKSAVETRVKQIIETKLWSRMEPVKRDCPRDVFFVRVDRFIIPISRLLRASVFGLIQRLASLRWIEHA